MMVCGLAGFPELAADMGVVQGATLALFFAFSANTRNVIFADPSGSAAHLMLRTRLLLLLPLAVLSFILSCVIGSVEGALALVLIVRRSSEWIGEVYLSSYEVHNVTRPAVVAITSECATFLLSVALIFLGIVTPAMATVLWALAPLSAAAWGRLAKPAVSVGLAHNLAKLAPNLGSTTIIGIAVYVFRLSLILLVGRVVAGDLFTAFAIGGLIPTVYNSSIGPSLAFRNHRYGAKRKGLTLLLWLVPVLFVLGGAITGAALFIPVLGNVLHKGRDFWTCVGLSISGGAIMISALHRRITMLQRNMNVEIFGSDVLSNVLIVVVIPYFYYLLGPRSLEGLYLFSAIVNLCFYLSAHRMDRDKEVFKHSGRASLSVIAGLVFLPFFFQLGGGIFRDSSFIFDAGRVLKQLPIPVSVIALFAGILLLGRFKEAHRSLTVFFFTALTLVLASLIVQERDYEAARLVLMAQYLLPVLGLVLGEIYGVAASDAEFEKTCLVILCLVVPLQLASTWAQGLLILTPYLYAFSIYQHLQYVPVVMVIGYGMGFVCLWGKKGGYWKAIAAILLPLIAVYAGASGSIGAPIILFVFVGLAVWGLYPHSMSGREAVLILAAIPVVWVFYNAAAAFYGTLDQHTGGNRGTVDIFSSQGLGERLKEWEFYAKGIGEGFKGFVFGHARRPDLSVHPSAYNYYLDLLYNFGFLALLPLLSLIVYTARSVWRYRLSLKGDPGLLAAAAGVFVIFMMDNMMKVGLRQPYPGIFGFLVLGLLQARLVRVAGGLTDTNGRSAD